MLISNCGDPPMSDPTLSARIPDVGHHDRLIFKVNLSIYTKKQ